MLQHCGPCGTDYAWGLPACPQCWTPNPEAEMAKITTYGGPSFHPEPGAVSDAEPSQAPDVPEVAAEPESLPAEPLAATEPEQLKPEKPVKAAPPPPPPGGD